MPVIVLLLLFTSATQTQTRNGADFFQQKIRPIVMAQCQGCHNNALKYGGFSMDSATTWRMGGSSGPVLVAGNPQASRLYRRVSRQEKPYMPFERDPLSDDEVALLKRWIEMGAGLPADAKEADAEKARLGRLEAMKKLENARVITEKERQWWAFQKPIRPAVPAVRQKSLVRNPIDAFVLAAQESKGLQPAPVADRRMLIRRLYFDLIGLPPKPEEVEAFLDDTSPDAYRNLVEKLLDSDRYGERWARHWLDVARYADGDGYEYDKLRPHSWRYRDYVIRAFNQDKPYDRFIREQLAGDELADRDYDAIIALGFLRNGPFVGDMALMQNEQTRMDELDDIVAGIGAAFLGLTVGCARCHDHKYDPILQKDYYRMVAVFAPTVRRDLPLAPAAVIDQYESKVKEIDDRIDAVKKEIAALTKATRERLLQEKYAKLPEAMQIALKTDPAKRTEAQKLQADQIAYTVKVSDMEVVPVLQPDGRKKLEKLNAKIGELEKAKPPELPLTQAVAERGPLPPPSYFLHRGNVSSKGSEMSPGTISVLNPPGTEPRFPVPATDAKTTGRRLTLANWIASAENPLTARVMMNRVWLHHFGRTLVGTPNDFGRMGERPWSPELLDWLATEFVRQGWSIKAMHRLMVCSRTYQQSSMFDDPRNKKIDPENRYLWKMPLRRLEGEIIRDSILDVSGALRFKMGGPGVFPEMDAEVLRGAPLRMSWPKTPDGPESWRRSVYITQPRSITAPILDMFDPPDNVSSCPRRTTTTVAPQALQLLNNRFVTGQSAIFADRVRNEAGRDFANQVRRAFYLALGRPPQPPELQAAVEFLKRQTEYHVRNNKVLLEQGTDPAEVAPPGHAALVDLCQSVFNLNEFVYVN